MGATLSMQPFITIMVVRSRSWILAAGLCALAAAAHAQADASKAAAPLDVSKATAPAADASKAADDCEAAVTESVKRMRGRDAQDVQFVKTKRVVTDGIVHVQASFNNTVITITDRQGNALSWATSGGAATAPSSTSSFLAVRPRAFISAS